MFHSKFFAAAIVCSAVLAAPAAAQADLSGNWQLSYITRSRVGASEVNICIVNVEIADGKPTAKIVATPPKALKFTVKQIGVAGKEVTLALSNGETFVGLLGADPDRILGSAGPDQTRMRAQLVRTEKDAIATPFAPAPTVAEPFAKALKLATRPTTLRLQIAREKDADKKKELVAELAAAVKEVDENVTALYRESVEKHVDNLAAPAAALELLLAADRSKVTDAEAKKLIAVIEKANAPFGEGYVRYTVAEAAEALANQKDPGATERAANGKLLGTPVEAPVYRKDLAAVAAETLKPLIRNLPESTSAGNQIRWLTAYKTALEGAGQTDGLTAVNARIDVLEMKLDDEYRATVPPFKPAPFAGRKDSTANRVAVMELFTGAQCPPCVAADVAFDALAQSYKPSDLVLIQYHMHIPGPDPMTNPSSMARWDYYQKKFPKDVGGTPTALFNGNPLRGGGGGMAAAQMKFNEYGKTIQPLLENSTPVKLSGKAVRSGDSIVIKVNAEDMEPDSDLRLRLILVEDTIRYVGGNKLRFHHHVVRGMPGGPSGVEVKEKDMKHSAVADISALRGELTKYLDGYALNVRPFPFAARPLDMSHLKVMALLQNDSTREILQAVQIEVEDKNGKR